MKRTTHIRLLPLAAASLAFTAALQVNAQSIDRSQARPPSDPEPLETEGSGEQPGEALGADGEASEDMDIAAGDSLADESAASPESESFGPNPVRPKFTENATLMTPGWFELETGYFLGLGQEQNLQRLHALAKFGISQSSEFRIGWDVFGQADVGSISTRGVGFPYGQAKFGVELPTANGGHQNIALLAEVRPGMGQDPVNSEGLVLTGLGIYSAFPGSVRVDVQTGLTLQLLTDEPNFWLPVSAAVTHRAFPWLDVFGEAVERVQLNDINASETFVGAGAGWLASRRVTVDGGVRIGIQPEISAVTAMAGLTWMLAELSESND